MKMILVLCVMLLISGCSQRSTKHNQVLSVPALKSQPNDLLEGQQKTRVLAPEITLDNYINWLTQAGHQKEVNDYKVFLRQYGLDDIAPDYDLLRSARDWQKCNAQEFEVPPQEIWSNIIPTLQILKQLVDNEILDDFTITSVYRNFNLNRCAGGADSSRHVFNAALDFRIGPENPQPQDLSTIAQSKQKLCKFWVEHGQSLNMGLGIYESGQIHIDSFGFRTWGPDHRNTSSICIANTTLTVH